MRPHCRRAAVPGEPAHRPFWPVAIAGASLGGRPGRAAGIPLCPAVPPSAIVPPTAAREARPSPLERLDLTGPRHLLDRLPAMAALGPFSAAGQGPPLQPAENRHAAAILRLRVRPEAVRGRSFPSRRSP